MDGHSGFISTFFHYFSYIKYSMNLMNKSPAFAFFSSRLSLHFWLSRLFLLFLFTSPFSFFLSSIIYDWSWSKYFFFNYRRLFFGFHLCLCLLNFLSQCPFLIFLFLLLNLLSLFNFLQFFLPNIVYLFFLRYFVRN